MASRRGAKEAVDLGEVEELLRRAKEIRKAYKALKKKVNARKDGEAVGAEEIRKLAEGLKSAIDGAGSGGEVKDAKEKKAAKKPRQSVAQAPTTPGPKPVPAPVEHVAPARVTVAPVSMRPVPVAETSTWRPAVGLGRKLLGFLANKLVGGRF